MRRYDTNWSMDEREVPELTLNFQDGSGWTPLMMAASRKEADEIVDILLLKSADVNMKSNFFIFLAMFYRSCNS